MRTATASLLPPPTEPDVDVVDVSVIVVNYNVREFLEQALDSVERASAGLSVETFVVDNNSVDGSVAMVHARFPEVRVIANEENVGFGRANNQAIREARGRYLLILNPDTLLQEDTLRTFVDFMDAHPEAGAAGCRILNPDGTFAPESRRAFPTPSVALYRMTGLSRLFPRSETFGRYNLTYLPIDEVCEVDALSGSCMLVRRASLYEDGPEPASDGRAAPEAAAASPEPGAGLFDEEFFMYGEDLDWCYRIQQAGWKIYYTPATQIIHYKGECTRKGELRYVRLFYGAMLQFTEKHFGNQYSKTLAGRTLAGLIRAGILARAGISVAGKALGRLAAPVFDFSLALFVGLVVALLWSQQQGVAFQPVYYTTLVPAYALAAVLCVAVAGGYRRGRSFPLRPVLTGTGTAFLAVTTFSFFVKSFAFSRATILIGFFAVAVVLTAWRVLVNRRQVGSRQALLVGSPAEAERLHALLARRIDPPLRLVGYVDTNGHTPTGGHADGHTAGNGQAGNGQVVASDAAVTRLGAARHLRDLVRLGEIDDVIFAADSLTNTAILRFMRGLRDLPVQFKILTQGQDRIIGKASVDDFSTPLRAAEQFVAPLRSALARRMLEVPVAFLGVLLHPALRLGLRLRTSSSRLRRLAAATARMPSVLAGRRALIGYDPSRPHPPTAWGLRPGVVSILDTLAVPPTDIVGTHRAYWFYARNQSAAFDAEILVRALFRQP
jgi:GT2 family glycosyltransferase